MAYDRTKEQTIVISKEHHTMLKQIADTEKRKLRNMTEIVIEKFYEQSKANNS